MEHITLKAAREVAGLSQQDLAEKSRVGKATISRIESGVITNPLNDTVLALEKALGLERGALVFREMTVAEERRAITDRRQQLRRRANRDEEGDRRATDRRQAGA